MAWGRHKSIPALGAPAPSLQLKDLEGNERSLAEMLATGPVLAAFYRASCPVCQFTFPFLERLHKSGGGEVQFNAVSQDSAADSRRFNREYGVSFGTLLDEERAGHTASNAYGISTVPTVVLIEKDGTVSWSMEGFVKAEMEALGRRLGVNPFQPGEYVPEWTAG